MKLKSSKYNVLIKVDGNDVAFNASNCVLVKVNDDFIRILNDPNQVLDDNLSALRNNMRQAGFLVEEDIDELKVLELKHWQSKFDSDTLTVTVMPTDACNFHCFYCFEKQQSIRMSEDTIERSINFIEQKLPYVKHLKMCWFGGEPMLCWDIIEKMSERLINLAEKHSCTYDAMMVTNGFLINNEHIPKFRRCKITALQITIDGNAPAHNKRRCLKSGAPTFDKIFSNVETLITNGFKIGCRINIDRSNADAVKPLIDKLSRRLGERKNNFSISFGQILPIAKQNDWDTSICFSTEEYSARVEEYTDFMIERGFNIPNQYPFYPTPKLSFCGASVVNSYTILPSGRIDKCWDCETLPVGDVRNGIAYNPSTEFNLSKWLTYSPFNDEECRVCRILPICIGGCPYFALEHHHKQCLKWKYNLEDIIRQKYLRHTRQARR